LVDLLTVGILLLLFLAAVPGTAQTGMGGNKVWGSAEDSVPGSPPFFYDLPYQGQFYSFTSYYTGTLKTLEGLGESYFFTLLVYQWRLGPLQGWGIFLLLEGPEGKVRIYEERMPDRKADLGRDHFRIELPGGLLENRNGEHYVRLDLQGFACELRLSRLLPPWRPGTGIVQLTPDGESFFGLAVAFPATVAVGWLELEERRIWVRGIVYGDRSLSVTPLNRQNSPLLGLRAFGEGCPRNQMLLAVLRATSHPEYGARDMPMLFLGEGEKWIMSSQSFSLQFLRMVQPEDSVFEYPGLLLLVSEADGYRLEGLFRLHLIWLTDIFQELPGFLRAVAEAFLQRPVIFRLAGSFRGTLTGPNGLRRELSFRCQGDYLIIR
jgi:hypothetical protein